MAPDLTDDLTDDLRKRHAYFYRDLDSFNAKFQQLGAVAVTNDGFNYIDEAKVPAELISAYRFLLRFGFANGLLPGEAGGGQ